MTTILKKTIYIGPLKVCNNGELTELKGTRGFTWAQMLDDKMLTLFRPNGVEIDEDDEAGSEDIYSVDPENLVFV